MCFLGDNCIVKQIIIQDILIKVRKYGLKLRKTLVIPRLSHFVYLAILNACYIISTHPEFPQGCSKSAHEICYVRYYFCFPKNSNIVDDAIRN